jgi:glucose-6-phosphate 1-epimerase
MYVLKSDSPGVHGVLFQGLESLRLILPSGDSAVVALQGAQTVSWTTADGVERLYFSPGAVVDGHTALRGGVPVCFPQFNQRGPLVKHGFARLLIWQLESSAVSAEAVTAVLALRDSEQTRAWWPQGFVARIEVRLEANHLRISLSALNSGDEAWDFTVALHSYLQVRDVQQVQLDGLDALARWDAVRDVHGVQSGSIAFAGEYDSVFAAGPALSQPLQLHGAGVDALAITQSPSWSNVVVWNPGAALCARLADMPADGYRHMLCVEAACVDQAVHLAPGDSWSGWQAFRALGAVPA